MIDVSKIIAYEGGEMDYDEIISMFQEMIDDGSVWQLQGTYGRMAHDLIRGGVCTASAEARKLWVERKRK